MMSWIGQISRKLGLYDRVRYSPLYDLILRFRNPSYLKSLDEDEAFYRMLFSGRKLDLIFDVGANLGDKAEVFARLAKRVICFEPDPRLARHLKRRFRHRPEIVIEACGLSDSEGVAELHAYDEGSAYNTFNARQHDRVRSEHEQHQLIPVPVTTLDAMMAKHGRPQFLKVDVEGHEKEVFAGLSQPVGLVSFEANLPEFAHETLAVARRLQSLASSVHFGVGGSGRVMTGEYAMTAEELGQLVMGPEAPPFLEVFAKLEE